MARPYEYYDIHSPHSMEVRRVYTREDVQSFIFEVSIRRGTSCVKVVDHLGLTWEVSLNPTLQWVLKPTQPRSLPQPRHSTISSLDILGFLVLGILLIVIIIIDGIIEGMSPRSPYPHL